jgi:hypothetical protein
VGTDDQPKGGPLAQIGKSLEGQLPSGRQIVVRIEETTERLEIRSPQGDVEVSLELTDRGPVLKLSGVRLDIHATDTVALNCKDFRIRTSETFAVDSGGRVEFKSRGDTSIDANWLNLNCVERAGSGYHDDPELPSAGDDEA